MSKDMKEAAKQYAEIEMKKVLNVRATAYTAKTGCMAPSLRSKRTDMLSFPP